MTVTQYIMSLEMNASSSQWNHVPSALQYIRTWAQHFGLRGLTVYYISDLPLDAIVSDAELRELIIAYDIIAKRQDASMITTWCLTAQSREQANDAKEEIRGLLLLFERLAGYGLAPFTDGRVRFTPPELWKFDWSVLPPHLQECEKWLIRFQHLRTEDDLLRHVQNANEMELNELVALRTHLVSHGEALLSWCEASNTRDGPHRHEAFQAEWLFLLLDFARRRLEEVA